MTRGFTATIFAYGQTGAGKTFSMFGTDFTSENRVKFEYILFLQNNVIAYLYWITLLVEFLFLFVIIRE